MVNEEPARLMGASVELLCRMPEDTGLEDEQSQDTSNKCKP